MSRNIFTEPIDYHTLGLYFPGFFTIHIKTDKDSFFKFTNLEISTYFHEYIHYMQNITTAHGINRFIYFMHQLTNLFSQIDKSRDINELLYHYRKLIYNDKLKKLEFDEYVNDNELPDKIHQDKIPSSPTIKVRYPRQSRGLEIA